MACKKDKFFQNFSSKLRIDIIDTLLESPKNVTQICEILKEEQSKISHNLKTLYECNFVSIRKEGKHRIYVLNKDTIVPLMKLVDEHVENFCPACNKD